MIRREVGSRVLEAVVEALGARLSSSVVLGGGKQGEGGLWEEKEVA